MVPGIKNGQSPPKITQTLPPIDTNKTKSLQCHQAHYLLSGRQLWPSDTTSKQERMPTTFMQSPEDATKHSEGRTHKTKRILGNAGAQIQLHWRNSQTTNHPTNQKGWSHCPMLQKTTMDTTPTKTWSNLHTTNKGQWHNINIVRLSPNWRSHLDKEPTTLQSMLRDTFHHRTTQEHKLGCGFTHGRPTPRRYPHYHLKRQYTSPCPPKLPMTHKWKTLCNHTTWFSQPIQTMERNHNNITLGKTPLWK